MKRIVELDEKDLIYVPIEAVSHTWKSFWIYTIRHFCDGVLSGFKWAIIITLWEGLKWWSANH